MAVNHLRLLGREAGEARKCIDKLLESRRNNNDATWKNASESLGRMLRETDVIHDELQGVLRSPSWSQLVFRSTNNAQIQQSCTHKALFKPHQRQRRATWHGGDQNAPSNRSYMKSNELKSNSAWYFTVGAKERARGERLENALGACERKLVELESRLESSPKPASEPRYILWNSSCLKEGEHTKCVELTTKLMLDFRDLGCDLEEIAASALQCSCERNVPGSMDVFEQTNIALDRVANAMQTCGQHGRENLY